MKLLKFPFSPKERIQSLGSHWKI